MSPCPHGWTENPGRKESIQFTKVVFISRSRSQAKPTDATDVTARKVGFTFLDMAEYVRPSVILLQEIQ
jgi:hypothetical protein